jgi:hypothetical protein
MRKLQAAFLGVMVVSSALSFAVTPAFALGGCGKNGHRNGHGECVFGGQNQDYCIKKTGHPAVRMPNGTMRCM